jgi:hypothetical protein
MRVRGVAERVGRRRSLESRKIDMGGLSDGWLL